MASSSSSAAAAATPSSGAAMEADGLEFLLDPVDRFPPREEFAERFEHPYPVPLALLSPREEAPALPADSNLRLRLCAAGRELQPWAVCRRVLPEEECLADPICEIHWEGESRSPLMDEESALPDQMPRASRMSALEQSIHKFAEEPTKSAVKPDLGLSFYLLGDAYDLQFVFLGGWLRHTVWGEQAERRADKVDARDNLWLSGCSGKPEAENGRSCRCKCPVLIRLLRASDNKLYITEYSENHNRSLSLTMVEKVHWPSHNTHRCLRKGSYKTVAGKYCEPWESV
ncbi:uncharacterized protein LOC119300714 isoform X2 [Triticum dicoccoides]|uniref:uncharacterized protein LOC119300714 isoform X2 n=1 Tax=Triticum dicoccoides TaxID=85692 RepID=UPI0018900B2C|nr:uncharacterized protein LOC119300714 isoform X2 [Triticum dicoccoides]